ncbi:MAG: Fe-S cluster assembly ATPase SufC [Clostridiales bacterium]|jgi:feS assembly ATPase sufC|nr:Fe-S cluster assembly ATPase SufC [Clostridiales bacterium]
MLKLENLKFNIANKQILDNFNLEIKDGEIHAIMGPNGIGKSTLTKIIMAHPDYKLESGKIYFDDNLINDKEVDEIAKMGIFVSFQNPIEIDGVTNNDFLKLALENKLNKKVNLYDFINLMEKNRKDLEIPKEFINRYVNEKASGGEKKKSEILQLKILEPKLIILDEIDSGLDIDSLKIVTENINEYLKTHKDTSVLIITHYPRILEYIKPNYVHIFNKGKIVKSSDYSLAWEIEKKGYKDEIN